MVIMKKTIAVYDITETITEIDLLDNPEKIFNIAKIFNKIVGEEDSRSHSTISAEFKDESSILNEYSEDRENFEIGSFAQKLLLAECSESSGIRKSKVKGINTIKVRENFCSK